MCYEEAWREVVKIVSNIKDVNLDDDLDNIILCIEYLQSELESQKTVVNA